MSGGRRAPKRILQIRHQKNKVCIHGKEAYAEDESVEDEPCGEERKSEDESDGEMRNAGDAMGRPERFHHTILKRRRINRSTNQRERIQMIENAGSTDRQLQQKVDNLMCAETKAICSIERRKGNLAKLKRRNSGDINTRERGKRI